MQNMRYWIVAVVLGLTSGVEAKASLTLVTTRTGTDTIDWGQLGFQGASITNPVTVASFGGVSATVSQTSTGAARADQGSGWVGNFTNGDRLYWTGGYSGINLVTLDFGVVGLSQIGTQIERAGLGPFTAQIEAFDSSGSSLGIVTEDGNSTNDHDGSAIYIGVSSTNHDISKIIVSSIVDGSATDFLINTVSLNPPAILPEPSTLIAAGLGSLAGLMALTRRRKASVTA